LSPSRGEIATKCGLTGWGEGEATEAAECCFKSWIGGFGPSEKHRDEVAILEHVRGFLESHGPTRFQRWETGDTQKVSNRLGFWRDEHGLRRYYVFTAAFKQTLCAGFEPRDVVRVLKTAGVLEVDTQGKSTQRTRLPCGIGLTRCYVLTSKIWEGEE
jgi:putative DNA primase/helicase